MKRPFSEKLVEWRDRNGYDNESARLALSRAIGLEISLRAMEGWIVGKRPHRIWRRALEYAIMTPQEQAAFDQKAKYL